MQRQEIERVHLYKESLDQNSPDFGQVLPDYLRFSPSALRMPDSDAPLFTPNRRIAGVISANMAGTFTFRGIVPSGKTSLIARSIFSS